MSSLTIKRTMALTALAGASLVLATTVPAESLAAGKRRSPYLPIVSTGTAHAVGNTVVLRGTINPRTIETTYYFRYGPSKEAVISPLAPQTTHATLKGGPSATEPQKISQTVTGLPVNDFYQLVAKNARNEEAEGAIRQFTSNQKNAFEFAKSFEPTVIDDTFVLPGTLSGPDNGDRQVVLQESPYPYSAPYVNVGSPIATSANGSFTFSVPDLRINTKFRVATVGTAPLLSDVIPELVAVRVNLKVRTTSRRGLVRLYGTVSPNEVGARVLIQLEKEPKQKVPTSSKPEKPSGSGQSERERPPAFATRFTTILKRATRSISRFSVVVKVKESGNYRAFVELPLGPLVSGHSDTIVLHAGPAKKRKK